MPTEPAFTENALKVLRARYLLRDDDQNIIETPAQMLKRVASAVARAEPAPMREEAAGQFYELMARRWFLPNSPTLMNAGTPRGQLSACFVLPVPDSIEGIFDALKHMALIHQSGGGTGFAFSQLRPKGSKVKSTGGVASGPVSFMTIFDKATEVIKQGGKRRGANMGVLSVHHPDVMEFVRSKLDGRALTNFNISVAATDGFMEAALSGDEYLMIDPHTGAKRRADAAEVFDAVVDAAWSIGDPGMLFIDEINRHNPTPSLGSIEATNPCVTADTWIMTSEGAKQVKDLAGRSFTAVVNGESWQSDERGFFCTGVKKIYKVKTKKGFELCLTDDHPVLRVKRITRYSLDTEWVRTGTLKPGDRVVMNNHRGLEGWGGKYTREEGYLIGLLLGDGTIKADKVVLSSWSDKRGARAIRSAAYGCASALPHRRDFRGWVEVKGRNEYRMSTDYLRGLATELGLKPGYKAITEEMEKASSEFYVGLLRGLFDADGCVIDDHSKGVSVRLSQSNLQVLKAVQRMLLRLGIFSKIYENRRNVSKRMLPDGKGGTKEYDINPQHELVISNDSLLQFYEKVGFEDVDKMEKLRKALESYRRQPNRDRFVATIEEVVLEGEEEVYDVSIPEINAFDANGFVVHNCGEQPLLPYESCNLGSINLSMMVEDGRVAWDRLEHCVRWAVRFLDDVIDVNVFPLHQIERMTKRTRKIGLGVMGFADMLIELDIPYGSKRSYALAEDIMRFIQGRAREESRALGEERGDFPTFSESTLADSYEHMRNATTTTIAPTGTISILANCSSGIEPLFSVVYVREALEGELLVHRDERFLKAALEQGFYSEELMERLSRALSPREVDEMPEGVAELFTCAFDLSPEQHIRMQAAFQKYTDNAVSKTINMRGDVLVDDVRRAYEFAWRLGCKGITVFRYRSRDRQVISAFGDVVHVRGDAKIGTTCPGSVCPL